MKNLERKTPDCYKYIKEATKGIDLMWPKYRHFTSRVVQAVIKQVF